MKMTRILAIHLAGIALAASAPAGPADQPHSHDRQPEWAEVFGGASLPTVWQSLTAAAHNASSALTAPGLDGVADMAETIHLGAHALADQVRLEDAGKKKRLDAALTQAAKIADDLLAAAQHHEPAAAGEALRRIQAAIALAKDRLPREITEAPAVAPRFAKAPRHDDHGKH